VYTEKVDYLPGLTREEKRARLAKMSYRDFLTQIVKLSPEVLPFFQSRTHDLYCLGIEAVAAITCFDVGDDYGYGYPGFEGMDLSPPTPPDAPPEEPYIFHFPDGCASIARMLVRSLIPGSVTGKTMEDVVLAAVDYRKLDVDSSPVQLRLSSTVIRVQQQGGPASAKEVEVYYARGGQVFKVRGRTCVLACYNSMIPYLCPELPSSQKEALAYCVKTPLVYVQVALRNWTSFHKLGIHQISAPGSYFPFVSLDFPVSMGGYTFAKGPEEPIVLFMLRAPCQPGLAPRDQHRIGRIELLETEFATFERQVREQLGRMLGAGGFDPARDIAGITVNRWAHGYAFQYDPLFDPPFAENELPHVVGRKPCGRIAIANCDAGGLAFMDAAIDQAHRAVQEIKKFLA
jgi:spermidine dehydrogenase